MTWPLGALHVSQAACLQALLMHATRRTRAEQCDGLTERLPDHLRAQANLACQQGAASGTLHDLSSSIRQALLKHAIRHERAEQWGVVALLMHATRRVSLTDLDMAGKSERRKDESACKVAVMQGLSSGVSWRCR